MWISPEGCSKERKRGGRVGIGSFLLEVWESDVPSWVCIVSCGHRIKEAEKTNSLVNEIRPSLIPTPRKTEYDTIQLNPCQAPRENVRLDVDCIHDSDRSSEGMTCDKNVGDRTGRLRCKGFGHQRCYLRGGSEESFLESFVNFYSSFVTP